MRAWPAAAGEVVPHHVPPSGAGEVCGVDVLAAADSEDFGAGDAGHLRPVRQRMDAMIAGRLPRNSATMTMPSNRGGAR